ncbi:hypothetical protein AVEN_106499-1 [Araneus ventricosus]|uniref:Uncharacterized protein n=1 Tax=Araneus ventricosus TaxID=182803 RepID=A0A4Y2X252_ARAVE|nr:hypothetical protein AVEN_106499-1 [Araneus ventricosus]
MPRQVGVTVDLWLLKSPQFSYWNNVMEFESLLLKLVSSVRSANFKLFVVTLKKICPWTVTLDGVRYSRLLPVFVRDLEEIPNRHPDIYSEFLGGRFTSNITTSAFLTISDNQFHEPVA